MPHGRTTRLTVRLTPQERQTLQTWQRSITLPAAQARRGRIILLLADGMGITQVATTVGINRRHVYKWIARFLAQGVPGLVGRQREGGAVPGGRRV
jgi:DNA invertase Pin-like site-specific DNA recombinase